MNKTEKFNINAGFKEKGYYKPIEKNPILLTSLNLDDLRNQGKYVSKNKVYESIRGKIYESTFKEKFDLNKYEGIFTLQQFRNGGLKWGQDKKVSVDSLESYFDDEQINGLLLPSDLPFVRHITFELSKLNKPFVLTKEYRYNLHVIQYF